MYSVSLWVVPLEYSSEHMQGPSRSLWSEPMSEYLPHVRHESAGDFCTHRVSRPSQQAAIPRKPKRSSTAATPTALWLRCFSSSKYSLRAYCVPGKGTPAAGPAVLHLIDMVFPEFI